MEATAEVDVHLVSGHHPWAGISLGPVTEDDVKAWSIPVDPKLTKDATPEKAEFFDEVLKIGFKYAFVVNETDDPVLVYVNTDLRPVIKDINAELSVTANAAALTGTGSAKLHLEQILTRSPIARFQVSPGIKHPVRVGKHAFFSVQRLDKDGNLLDAWDCINQEVEARRKLVITGTTASAIKTSISAIEGVHVVSTLPAGTPSTKSD